MALDLSPVADWLCTHLHSIPHSVRGEQLCSNFSSISCWIDNYDINFLSCRYNLNIREVQEELIWYYTVHTVVLLCCSSVDMLFNLLQLKSSLSLIFLHTYWRSRGSNSLSLNVHDVAFHYISVYHRFQILILWWQEAEKHVNVLMLSC